MNPTFALPNGMCGCVLCKHEFSETQEEHLNRVHSNPQVMEAQVKEMFTKSMEDMKEFIEWKQWRINS